MPNAFSLACTDKSNNNTAPTELNAIRLNFFYYYMALMEPINNFETSKNEHFPRRGLIVIANKTTHQ
jgi:hypothetical protein